MQHDGLKLESVDVVHEDWKAYYLRGHFSDEDGNLFYANNIVIDKEELEEPKDMVKRFKEELDNA